MIIGALVLVNTVSVSGNAALSSDMVCSVCNTVQNMQSEVYATWGLMVISWEDK